MATASTDDSQYTRLHITPLDESLLNVVISSSVLPKARKISYHTIETFPEKRYGFVELPSADADKLRKKLNGAVLRGSKMRIEKARPESIPEPTAEADQSKEKKPKDKSKKRKREIDAIPGVELEDRKVKRGWTTTEQDMIKEKREKAKKKKNNSSKGKEPKEDKKDKKKEKWKTKSKYTDGPECLFKTRLPESAPAKDSEDTADHKKKKRKGHREVIIHEFEKTVKVPSFLKSNTAKTSSETVTFEDGKGWVDSSGNVVEAASTKRPKPTMQAKPAKSSVPEPMAAEDEDDDTSSSGTSSDEESDSSDQGSGSSEEAEENVAGDVPDEKSKADAQTLSSPVTPLKLEAGRKQSSGSFSSLTIKIPPATTPAKVHPLEALYKRPKGEDGTSQGAPKEPEPFSFFDNTDIEEDDSMAPPSQPPLTPFTKQDFEYRGVRSAAPTPDTAHPSRSFNLWSRDDALEGALEEEDEDEDEGEDEVGEEDEEAEEQEGEDTAMAGTAEQGSAAGGSTEAPVSEFQKQFWESRGDLNRSWRKRRKMAAKEKRYRENKARAQRAI